MAKFKKPAGNWSCAVCMVSNSADKTACLACETPKCGSATESAKEPGMSFSIGANGGFKFDAIPSTSSTASNGGFIFGFKASSDSAAHGGGFKFETKPSNDSASSGGSGFKFDTYPSASNGTEISQGSSGSGFVFNTSPTESSTASSGGFSFGASKNVGSSVPGGFNFGTTSAAVVGDSDTPTAEADTLGGFKFSTQPTSTDGGWKFGAAAGGGAVPLTPVSSSVFSTPTLTRVRGGSAQEGSSPSGNTPGFQFGFSSPAEKPQVCYIRINVAEPVCFFCLLRLWFHIKSRL